jgi:hypothetical protein
LISAETLSKFLQDLENHIAEVDKANKEKADNVLKSIAENYRLKISERLAEELRLAEDCRRIGDDLGARHHVALAEVYKSLFNI